MKFTYIVSEFHLTNKYVQLFYFILSSLIIKKFQRKQASLSFLFDDFYYTITTCVRFEFITQTTSFFFIYLYIYIIIVIISNFLSVSHYHYSNRNLYISFIDWFYFGFLAEFVERSFFFLEASKRNDGASKVSIIS